MTKPSNESWANVPPMRHEMAADQDADEPDGDAGLDTGDGRDLDDSATLDPPAAAEGPPDEPAAEPERSDRSG
jgi:hypothetical protein